MDDKSGDELDDFVEHVVFEQKAHFDQTASTGKIDTPLFFGIILIINLHIADALK